MTRTSVEYNETLSAMLSRLQDAFYEILAIHGDETHLNPDSAKAKKVMEEFVEAHAAIFRFKCAWSEIQAAISKSKKR